MEPNHSIYPENKMECYALLKAQIKALLDGETNVIANLANASALLNEALTDINWVGFYLRDGEELILGPFQGRPACVHIASGRGVCGTAVLQNRTLIVPDVHRFPGHIACDCDSVSEIVIPLHGGGADSAEQIVGVLDIDSPITGRFDEEDARELEQAAAVIQAACWPESPYQ